jgi:prophage DNA circulation protein
MPAPDYSKLTSLGSKMTEFQSMVEKFANELEPGHPQKELVQRLASMLKSQQTAVVDSVARFHETAGEYLANSKRELEEFQSQFAEAREKAQKILDAAKSGTPPSKNGQAAANGTPEVPKIPAVHLDPKFGENLGRELLNRYLNSAKHTGKAFDDREIWQDWT